MAEQNIEKLAPRRKTYTTQKAQNCSKELLQAGGKEQFKENEVREWVELSKSTKEVWRPGHSLIWLEMPFNIRSQSSRIFPR